MIGTELRGYRIIEKFQSGAMGEVYLAERADAAFQRKAIIKLVGTHLPESERARFNGERQALALINHPNVAQIYDGGQLPEDGRPFMIMEYVEGEMLRYALYDQTARQQGEWVQIALPPALAVNIAVQACAGLGAAHERQIIHRDIKPENIVIQSQGDKLIVKLIDFGLALPQVTGLLGTHQNTSGIVGTAAYMSPEQIAPDLFLTPPQTKPGPPSDVYSLAVVVYEMLAGRLPFQGETAIEFVNKHVNTPPPSLRAVRPDLNLPAALDAVVLKALSKRPEQRQRSMVEFAADLQAALQPQPAPPDRPLLPTEVETSTPARPAIPPTPISQPRRRVWLWSLPVLLLLAVLGYWQPWRTEQTGQTVALENKAGVPLSNVAQVGATATLSVEAWRQDKGQHKNLLAAGAVVRSGEGLRLVMTASASGQLAILQRNARGAVSRLFPDQRINDGKAQIEAGKSLNLPPQGWFRFDANTGTETIYVLFSAQPDSLLTEALQAPLAQAGVLEPVQATSLIERIEMRAAQLTPTGNRVSGPGALVNVLQLSHQP